MNELFGKKAKDKVTGFTGIITGVSMWMYGCNQYCIIPPVDKDGKMGDGQWFDEGRVEVIQDAVDPASVKGKKNGADQYNMPKAR